ncbi:hypothetical protein [Streptomyces sp. NBC_00338]|uniref:hypothetical protein n=1 Tax=Streptomyces sp. NBC_00338 TaxID=2975715 RepID=UPI00224E7BC7|nr:hypothetical protein [Streptomyces sp. NBC_00338]MCX5140855.1 hypothetical protein [Streptomyces sp. NBC_00338]
MNTALDLIVKIATGALGGAVVVLALAPWVAHRQEVGKARAAALLELRQVVMETMAYNAYHHARGKAQGSYQGDPLSVTHRARVVCDMVMAAWKLSQAQQRRVRAALVSAYGELTVQLAERLAMTPFQEGHSSRDSKTWMSALEQLSSVESRELLTFKGTMDRFAENPLDEVAHTAARADMEDLLKTLGGRSRLGGTRVTRRVG